MTLTSILNATVAIFTGTTRDTICEQELSESQALKIFGGTPPTEGDEGSDPSGADFAGGLDAGSFDPGV